MKFLENLSKTLSDMIGINDNSIFLIISSINLIVVLLPAPFAPISPIIVPPGNVRFKCSRAKFLYDLHKSYISIAFMIIPPNYIAIFIFNFI